MSLYNDIGYKEMYFPIGRYWSEISAEAYNGNQGFIDWIIKFNYDDIPEEQRHSLMTTIPLTLKIPDLDDAVLNTQDLPPWRE